MKNLTLIVFVMVLSGCGSSLESSGPTSETSGGNDTIYDVTEDSVPEIPEDSPGENEDSPADVSLKLDFCLENRDTGVGNLCVIRPSDTDSEIKDFAFPSGSGAGYGYHVIGFPKDLSSIKGVWIHFGGSYGKPHNPNNGGEIASLLWLNELMNQGYLVLQLAYANQKAVNLDYCKAGTPGSQIDRCSYKVRQEILKGEDLTDLLDVNPANSYFHRLDAAIDYLKQQGIPLPQALSSGAVDWSKIVVSGHSQGAGHAAMMAKYTRVRAACLIGGPYDTPDIVNLQTPLIADWYLDPEQETPIKYYGAFVVDTDIHYDQFIKTYDILGLVKNSSWFESPGMVYTNKDGEPIPVEDGHPASISALELAPQRAKACFGLINK